MQRVILPPPVSFLWSGGRPHQSQQPEERGQAGERAGGRRQEKPENVWSPAQQMSVMFEPREGSLKGGGKSQKFSLLCFPLCRALCISGGRRGASVRSSKVIHTEPKAAINDDLCEAVWYLHLVGLKWQEPSVWRKVKADIICADNAAPAALFKMWKGLFSSPLIYVIPPTFPTRCARKTNIYILFFQRWYAQ